MPLRPRGAPPGSRRRARRRGTAAEARLGDPARRTRMRASLGRPARARRLSFAGMTEMRIGRLPDERLAGRPALVVESDEGDAIQIATVGEVGALFELADRIAGAQTDRGVTAQRLVVVVPLKAGARNKV